LSQKEVLEANIKSTAYHVSKTWNLMILNLD